MLHLIKFSIGSMKVYETYISIMLFSMYILYSLKKYKYGPYPQSAFIERKILMYKSWSQHKVVSARIEVYSWVPVWV